MDLAGIEPDQHWGVMAGLAERAELTRLWGVDLGLRPLPHGAGPLPRGHPRVVDAHGRARCSDEPGSAGADVHVHDVPPVSYTHLRAHEPDSYLVCRLLLEKKN